MGLNTWKWTGLGFGWHVFRPETAFRKVSSDKEASPTIKLIFCEWEQHLWNAGIFYAAWLGNRRILFDDQVQKLFFWLKLESGVASILSLSHSMADLDILDLPVRGCGVDRVSLQCPHWQEGGWQCLHADDFKKSLVFVTMKPEREWPHFLLEPNPNTLLEWGKSGSEKHYLDERTGKREENGAIGECALVGRESLALGQRNTIN